MRWEIADESRTNLASREKWQKEMTKLRMQLNYQCLAKRPVDSA